MLQYGVTREALKKILDDGEGWDIIHFSGHGLAAHLILEKLDCTTDRVPSDQLAQLLRPTRPIERNGLGLTPSQADRILSRVESSAFRRPETDDVYAEWRRLVAVYVVSGKNAHDARLVASMMVNRITHILTFNVGDFAKYPSLTVLDPSKL